MESPGDALVGRRTGRGAGPSGTPRARRCAARTRPQSRQGLRWYVEVVSAGAAAAALRCCHCCWRFRARCRATRCDQASRARITGAGRLRTAWWTTTISTLCRLAVIAFLSEETAAVAQRVLAVHGAKQVVESREPVQHPGEGDVQGVLQD